MPDSMIGSEIQCDRATYTLKNLSVVLGVEKHTMDTCEEYDCGISCPGCGMSRAVLLMLSGHFRAAFRMHPLVYAVLPAGIWLFFGPEQTAGLRRFKKGIITVLVVLLLAVYAWRIYYHDPLLSIDPSLGRVLQWFYLN